VTRTVSIYQTSQIKTSTGTGNKDTWIRKTNQERGITLALDGGDLASGIMVLFELENEILAHAHLTLHMDHV